MSVDVSYKLLFKVITLFLGAVSTALGLICYAYRGEHSLHH